MKWTYSFATYIFIAIMDPREKTINSFYSSCVPKPLQFAPSILKNYVTLLTYEQGLLYTDLNSIRTQLFSHSFFQIFVVLFSEMVKQIFYARKSVYNLSITLIHCKCHLTCMREKYSIFDQIVLRKASNGKIRFGSIAQKSNAISTAIEIVQDRTSTGYTSGYYEGDVSRSCVSIFGTYLYINTIVLSAG